MFGQADPPIGKLAWWVIKINFFSSRVVKDEATETAIHRKGSQ